MRENSHKPGRRTVLHEYLDRDTPWVEDIGLATVTFAVSGFLIGDDVFDQRDAMRAACDQAGPGEFVHPSLGSLPGSVINPSFAETDRGRSVQFAFTFIQSPDAGPRYPSGATSTQDGLNTAADSLDDASGVDFVADVVGAVSLGVAVVQGMVATVTGFVAVVVGTAEAVEHAGEAIIALPGEILAPVLSAVGQVAGLIHDSAVFAGAVLGLVAPPGSFYGRYASVGLTVPLSATATVASQLAASVEAVSLCADAAGACIETAGQNPLGLPLTIQASIAALLAAIPSPADQIRLLVELAGYEGATATSAAPIGAAVALAQSATASLVRRAALAALARAEAGYQPTSFDDAAAVRQSITALLDTEIISAADAGDNGSFIALRALRAATVLDLTTRGSLLPRLVTITRTVSLPSLRLAYELYGDASRSDDLIARVDPPHPGFMPLQFRALSY